MRRSIHGAIASIQMARPRMSTHMGNANKKEHDKTAALRARPIQAGAMGVHSSRRRFSFCHAVRRLRA